MKICTKCSEEKKLTEFYADSRAKDGRQSECKACYKACRRIRFQDTNYRLKYSIKTNDYRRKNPEKVSEWNKRAAPKHIETRRNRQIASPRGTLLRLRAAALKRRPTESGITQEEVLFLWGFQDGRCALSGIKMTWGGGNGIPLPTSVSLDRIDPNRGYERGNVRLLCHAVNTFRGRMSDAEMVAMAKSICEHNQPRLRVVSQ